MDPAPQPAGPPAPPEKSRSLVAAVVAGLALAGLVLGSIMAGPVPFFVVAAIALVVAQAELYGALRSVGHHPARVLGMLFGAVMLVSTFVWGPLALALSLALPLPLLAVWAVTVPVETVRSMITSTYLGVVYGPFLAAFAVLLLREPNGRMLIVGFIGMTGVFDSGAYLVGRKLGRHPMAARTSPNKSWEGFAGGLVLTVGLSALILPMFEAFDLSLAVGLALVMSAFSPIGDLAESLVKRDLGVKDMGSLIPGHGGLFDRIDAIIFNAPLAYLVLVGLGWAA